MKTYAFKSVLITFRAKGFSHRLFSVNYFKFLRIQKQRSRGVLRIRFLKICSKFTGENPCRNAISIKLLGTFIKIALQHGCSPVNLLHIFRTPFFQNTFEWLLQWKAIFQDACDCFSGVSNESCDANYINSFMTEAVII